VISDLILQAAAMEQHERLIMIRTAWDAYKGKLPASLKVQIGQPNDNVNLNFARTIVDDGVSFLFGDEVEFEAGDKTDEASDDSSAPDPADQWLKKFWEKNHKMTLLGDVALNGGVCGHAFLRVRLPDESKGEKFPRLINLDPATVTPVWNPDDYQDVLFYVIQWNAIEPRTMRPMTRRQVIECAENGLTWSITDEASYGDSKVWVTLDEPEIWTFPWAPIFHCQNLPAPNEFWGQSDLESDVVDVLKSINYNTSNIARILRFHAHPKTWGYGFAQRDLKVDVDNTIVLPNKEARLQNLEMTSDLTSSIEFYKRLKEALHEIAQHPEIATGKLESAGPLSGVALNILYRPLLQKTAKKRRRYGDMLTDLNCKMLELAGFGDRDTQEIETHWPNLLPDDAKEEADTALVLEGLGVSKDTLLQRLGFDPELEKEKKAKEVQDAADVGAAMLKSFDKGQIPGQNSSVRTASDGGDE